MLWNSIENIKAYINGASIVRYFYQKWKKQEEESFGTSEWSQPD